MFVSAQESFHTKHGELVRRGDILDAEHPLALRLPHLFKTLEAVNVEQKTRAPGEFSTARRSQDGTTGADGGSDNHGDTTVAEDEDFVPMPSKSGRKDDWIAYAIAQGKDPEGLNRDEIVTMFE